MCLICCNLFFFSITTLFSSAIITATGFAPCLFFMLYLVFSHHGRVQSQHTLHGRTGYDFLLLLTLQRYIRHVWYACDLDGLLDEGCRI